MFLFSSLFAFFVCLFVYLSVCMSLCMIVCLNVCLLVCLFIYFFYFDTLYAVHHLRLGQYFVKKACLSSSVSLNFVFISSFILYMIILIFDVSVLVFPCNSMSFPIFKILPLVLLNSKLLPSAATIVICFIVYYSFATAHYVF